MDIGDPQRVWEVEPIEMPDTEPGEPEPLPARPPRESEPVPAP